MDKNNRLSLPQQEVSGLGEGAQRASAWQDPFGLSKGPKGSVFGAGFGSGMKFEEQEARLDDFTKGGGLPEPGQWPRFSPATAALPGLGSHGFNPANLSASPENSETTTPPSIPSAIDRSLNGPGINDDYMLPSSNGFGAGVDELWGRGIDEFDAKHGESRDSLQLSYPPLDSSLETRATLPSLRSLSMLGHGFPFSPNAPPFGAQLPPFTLHNPHNNTINKDQSATPPPGAPSTNSSGSSTPFMGALFDQTPAGWRNYTPEPPFYPEWNVGTCDPRGITAQKYDLAVMHDAEQALMMPLHSPQPQASPALSEGSAVSEPQEGSAKRIRGRPRRSESALDTPYKLAAIEDDSPYRPKKRSGEEAGGMGLDDVDETTLEFTSRQDAKPTRTLRRQCFNCRTWRDVSAWRRSVMQSGHIVCNKCGLYEKAHKKSRPLNERGEFVRPGKHVSRVTSRGVGRTRPKSRAGAEPVTGTGVMKFETNEDATK